MVLPDPSRDLPIEAASSTIRRISWSHVGKLVFSLVLGVLLLYALQKGGLPLLPAKRALSNVRWWTVPCYLALLGVSTYFRGVRWRLLLRPVADVSGLQALNAVLVGSAAVVLLPLRLGEMARPYLVARDKRISMLTALGSVVAERIIDGLVLSVILGAALVAVPTLTPLPSRVVGIPIAVASVRGYAWFFLFVFGVAFASIVVFHAARDVGVKTTHVVFGRISPRLDRLIATTFERFADGLSFFRHPKITLHFLFETGIYWLFGALSYWLLGWGTGVVHGDYSAMSFGEACAIMGMLGIATVLPGPPGLLGLFQAGVYAAMTMYFPEDVVTGPGSAYVFLLYSLQVGFVLVCAAVCLGLEVLGRRSALRRSRAISG